MPQQPLDYSDLFGTDPHILYRRDGPSTSRAAAYSIDTGRLEWLVLLVISSFDQVGCISDEVRHRFPPDTPYSSVTARYRALDDKGLIRRFDWDKRPGDSGEDQMVMRISQLGRRALFMNDIGNGYKKPRTRKNGKKGSQATP